MASADWLTQDELLAELDQAGITLAERTLRFWVANGVLDSPVRKPFRGADGRVGYYPRDTLALVPRVLKLQEEGWKLRQIKQRLQQPDQPEKPHRPVAQNASGDGEELARRYLADLMSDTEANDRRRCFSSPGASHSELRQIRHYLVARLERLVGRGIAVRTTSAFLLGLDAKDMKRLVTRLRVSSSARKSSAEPGLEPADDGAVREALSGADRKELMRKIGQQASGLEGWLADPKAPLLLRRALSTLRAIESTLSKKEPGTAGVLARELAILSQIEQHAVADLLYLQQAADS